MTVVAVVDARVLLEAVDVELAEVLLRNHGQVHSLLLWLRLWDLELRGIEVEKIRLHVLLGLLLLGLGWLRGRRWVDRVLLLLLLLLLRALLLRLTLHQDGWILADVVDEWGESRVAEKGLDQATVTLILVLECLILLAEAIALLCLDGNFAFELGDVLCDDVSIWSHVSRSS